MEFLHRISIIEHGSPEYSQMLDLRRDILRKPLGLDFSPAELNQEAGDILMGCFIYGARDVNTLIGCCVLSPQDSALIRLRQMAVLEKFRKRGTGKALLDFAHKRAHSAGFLTMMLHARKTVVPFYLKFGYEVCGAEFIEVGIPHLEMRRSLIQ